MPLLEQAAAVGDPRAQYLLGVALYNGDHIAADAARASELLAAAAAAGVAQAQAALEDIAGSTRPADREMIVSARCAEHVLAEFARLQPLAEAAPLTLEALARDVLRPLLRERLETLLPSATRRAVNEILRKSSRA